MNGDFILSSIHERDHISIENLCLNRFHVFVILEVFSNFFESNGFLRIFSEKTLKIHKESCWKIENASFEGISLHFSFLKVEKLLWVFPELLVELVSNVLDVYFCVQKAIFEIVVKVWFFFFI